MSDTAKRVGPTDIFVTRPVLAIVISLVLVMAGIKAATTIAVLEYPQIESSSLIISTAYVGASARTVQGFITDPIERVFALLEVYRRGLLVSGCTRGCPVGNLALELGDRKPRARALMNEYFTTWTGRVQRWLVAADDRLPAELDRESLSRLVLAVMEGGVMQARAAGSLDPYDAAVAQLRSYFRLLASYARREPAEALRAEAGESFLEPVEAAEPAETADASGWRYW